MKLYIANTTKQRFTFSIRRLETNQPYFRHILPGSQEMVLDTDKDEIDMILSHLRQYGLQDALDIDQSRAFIGKCYSIGKPVSATTIEKAMRENDDHLTQKGYDRRQAAALAQKQTIEQSTGREMEGDLEFSVDQDVARNAPRDLPTVNEKLVVKGRGSRGGRR